MEGRRRTLGVTALNGVYLTRLTTAGRKVCKLPVMDVDGAFGGTLQLPDAKGRPRYTGRGRWGKPVKRLGASLYEMWRERLPGVLERSQLTLEDFTQPDPEYRSGAPPPS